MQTPLNLSPIEQGRAAQPALGRGRLAAVVFTGSLLLLAVRWFVPRPVGAADNGDGWRLLCHLGGREPDRISEDWVRMAYRPSPPCHSGYVSSQEWLDHGAQWLGHRLGDTAALNLYVLGALTCVLVAGAVTVVAMALPLSGRRRLVAAALVWLALADSAVFGWFVSVVSEGAAFLGLVFATAGLLLLQRPDRWRYVGAALTFAGGVVAVNAKAQTLLILPALLLALLLARKVGRTAPARWALPTLVLLATVGVTAVVQTSGDPAGAEYRQANAYHVIFNSILDGDHNASADLAELGLPASWAQYRGTNWWSDRPAYTDPAWPAHAEQVNMHAVAHWYLEHPARTVGILHRGAQDLLTARPANIGSFVEGSGQPAMAQEFRVPLYSGMTRLIAPSGLWVLLPLWALLAAVVIPCWRRARPVAVVVVFALTAAVGQFLAAGLGEGIEGVKHQVIALFCTFLAAALAAATLTLPRRPGSAPTPCRPNHPE